MDKYEINGIRYASKEAVKREFQVIRDYHLAEGVLESTWGVEERDWFVEAIRKYHPCAKRKLRKEVIAVVQRRKRRTGPLWCQVEIFLVYNNMERQIVGMGTFFNHFGKTHKEYAVGDIITDDEYEQLKEAFIEDIANLDKITEVGIKNIEQKYEWHVEFWDAFT